MDKNAKHTPGPWTEFRDDDSHDIIADDGTHIAQMEPVNGLAPQREQDANACLIAAAPDLLAALENLVGQNFNRPDPAAFSQARAAITKAHA